MAAPSSSASANATPPEPTQLVLHGQRLLLARVVWVVLYSLSALILLLGIYPFYQATRRGIENALPTLNALAELNVSPESWIWLQTILVLIILVLYLTISLLIFIRRADNWMAIQTSIGILGFLTFFQFRIADSVVQTYPILAAPTLLIRVIGVLFSLGFCYTFPDGSFVPRWTRYLFVVWTLIAVLWLFFPDLPANLVHSRGFLRNVPVSVVFLGLWYGTGVVAQIQRYRLHSTLVQRQQMKWGMYVIALITATFVIAYALALTVNALIASASIRQAAAIAQWLMLELVLCALPIGLAFSMSRYRLWDVDFIINRSLVYGALSILLAMLFFGSVFVLDWITKVVTNSDQTTIVIGASALVIGSLFQPARRRLQRFVDANFYGGVKPLRGSAAYRAAKASTVGRFRLIGSRFGSYEIVDEIAQGGMGEVYLGKHVTLERTVAIKILPSDMATQEEFLKRFEQEARIVAGLQHPNIVPVYDFGLLNNVYYMVMDYIDGQTLTAYLREVKQLPLHQARPIIWDVANALEYAHLRGLVHRDIKPSNIMLQRITSTTNNPATFRAMLMDFGIAKLTTNGASGEGLTRTGMLGTLEYVSPEQIVSSPTIDGRADIYALGVVAYQMLTGQLPYKADSAGATLMAHMTQPVPDPRTIVLDMPEPVAMAIMCAMAKEPSDRFPTAVAFVQALEG